MSLAAVVMLASTADRDAHYHGSFAQAEVLVKDEVQSFTLPARQAFHRVLKQRLGFGFFESHPGLFQRRNQGRRSFGTVRPSQPAQNVLAMLADGGLANHCKQPGL